MWSALLLAAAVAGTESDSGAGAHVYRARPEAIRRPIIVFELGPELGWRRVSYRDRLTPQLAGYQSGAMGLLAASAELYPAARSELPVLRDLGLVGAFRRSLTESVLTADGRATLHDTWTGWDAGLRWRGIFNGWEWLGVSLRYGSMIDQLTPGITGALLPSGTVSFVRPGVDVRVPAGPVSLLVWGGYLAVVSDNVFARDFPRSTQGGIDAGAGIRLRLSALFDVQLSGQYTRFFYSLYPKPGDPYVAGGALDEYGVIDLAFLLHT
jgi:hypothetical protein